MIVIINANYVYKPEQESKLASVASGLARINIRYSVFFFAKANTESHLCFRFNTPPMFFRKNDLQIACVKTNTLQHSLGRDKIISFFENPVCRFLFIPKQPFSVLPLFFSLFPQTG